MNVDTELKGVSLNCLSCMQLLVIQAVKEDDFLFS
jgi:hypothetical protein